MGTKIELEILSFGTTMDHMKNVAVISDIKGNFSH